MRNGRGVLGFIRELRARAIFLSFFVKRFQVLSAAAGCSHILPASAGLSRMLADFTRLRRLRRRSRRPKNRRRRC